jgi:hypothetical protein
MAQTGVTSKCCEFHQYFRKDIRLTLPSVEIRKPNRYQDISQVIRPDFSWRFQKITNTNFMIFQTAVRKYEDMHEKNLKWPFFSQISKTESEKIFDEKCVKF